MAGQVEAFYDRSPDYEWNRLERHRMEFAVTMRALLDFLPPPPAAILDIGGGPGRYAIALTRQGYRVTLFDLSANNLIFAAEQARLAGVSLAGFEHGTATDLSRFPADRFDAILLMGPLYHLLDSAERQQAVREALRVLQPGGHLAASFIARYAPLRDAALQDPELIVRKRADYESILSSGIYEVGPNGGFTSAFFAHPSEVIPLMESCGCQTDSLLSCEGVVSMIEDRIGTLEGDLWEAWVEVNYRLSRDPAILGCAGHLLYLGRKAGQRL